MFRRARLSVKPNVRPGVGARGITAPNPQRGQEAPRPPEPAAASAPKPAEPTDETPVDFGGADPQEEAPRTSDEKTDGENDVEESGKSPSTVSQRRKRISSTATLVKPSVSVPSEPHPLSTVNQEAPQPKPIPTKEKQPCSDRYRIYKAQKLREMLKEELRKEKKQWKNKYAINESQRPQDRSKMTMRDFIYYLPDNNPMTSSLEQEKRTEKSSTPVQTRVQEDKSTPEAEDNEEVEEEMDDGPLLVPRVKVAEDGSIILDEESLTVEVLRTKGPCVVEENDPIFERGSTTTYSSFRKNYYSKPWSNKETDMFFLAISMVGTDFSMIGQLFPHRARIEIKKKVAREEGVSDDPDESLSAPTSDTEDSQKDAQTVEEQQSLTLSGQDSDQIALEPDLNQKKRRRNNQGEVGKEGVKNLSGNATVQPGSSKGEKPKNECQSLRPEINEDEGYKEQKLKVLAEEEKRKQKSIKNQSLKEKNSSKPQKNIKVSSQNDAMSVATETSESSILDLDSLEVGIRSLCEVNNAETSCTEERNTDLKTKSLETDQTENVKPKTSLSEKMCLRKDDQPKVFRPARLTRGRFQRPKPNVGKADERKEILASQEEIGANVERNENESCINRDTPEQIEDQLCKNFECKDITSESEKKDNSFQNVQLDEPKALNECLSIQEDNKTNTLKQIPVLKNRFQKPKPNIGRGSRRRDIFSKEGVPEDILASAEKTAARLETSPKEKVPMEGNTTKEMESELNETERRDISPREKIPETIDITVEMETDLKETGREMSPREKIPEMTDTTEERETDLDEAERREIALQENAPEEVNTVGEVETGLKETGREISPREKIPQVTDVTEERETDLEETEKLEISSREKAPEVTTIGEMETDLKEIEKEISPREKVLVGISVIGEMEINLKETGKRDISLMEKVSGKMTVIEETEADLKETGRKIPLRKSGSEEISATEEITDLKKTGKIDISLREKEPEETGTLRQTETDSMQSSSGDCGTLPPLNITNINSEVPSMVHTPVEEKRSSEKEVSSQLSHLKTSSQASEHDKTEDHGMQSPDILEKFSDMNLSKSLPQEQKPFEVKPAPFVRIRFKKPKPNLSRAALKRETTEAGKYVPGKKLETDKMETVTVQQGDEQVNPLPSQHDVASLMTSREKDKSGHRQNEAVLPCLQTEQNLSPSSSCEPTEESQSTQVQKKELAVSVGTHNINTSQQEMKESVIQTARPARGRLQRPRPNIRKAGQRQIAEKGEAKGIIKEERTILQKDTTKTFLTVPSSQIGTEIEVVSSKVSEGRMCENQSHVVLAENLQVNKINVLDEKMRHEHETYVSSPAQLIRRQFQKTKPNLGRARGKKEELAMEKDRADQTESRKPEDNLLQQGDPDTQLLQKEKAELLTSLGVSARKDCVDSKEFGLAKKHAQSEVGPSASVGQKTVGDNSVSSVVEEQHRSKLTSCSQRLKESKYSKIALNRRTTVSSASGCEIDHSERRTHRKIKPNVTKGRGSKRIRSKTSKKEPRAPKSMLVTLRASQQEDEDDDEDLESDYEEESYHLAPEEVNKAPVFVPFGLRSPEPVSAQIEETMEELEITVNVPDIGFITVDEHQFSNTDVATQEMKQEENLNALSIEMTTGEHTQDETGTNDGSTEAAITLLTMGDLVLQSEISTEQSDARVCVLPDVHSKDQSHIPFSPDNVNHKIVHECQELSSPVSTTSIEENKIVLEEQSTKEEIGLMEKVKGNTITIRNTTSEVTNNSKMRSSRFVKPKPVLRKTLGTNRFGAYQEDPSLFVTKGEEAEIQRETEKNASQAIELEDQNLGSATAAESKEQSRLAHAHRIEDASISQDTSLPERKEDQEEGSQELQILSVAPTVSLETMPHTLGLGRGLGESSVGEPLKKDSDGDSMLTLYGPECIPTSIPEVQQESVISPQDLAANLVADVHNDGEDEQAFILTLVEIPTNGVEEFTDPASQLMPNPLLPAPILVKSVNMEEKGDMSMSFPVTSVGQDAMCLSNSGRDDSEKPPASLDLISRKRFHCSLDESDHASPAKKTSLTSRDDCQKYTPEVCSKELIKVFEERGKSYKGQDIFPTSESTRTTPGPQKVQLEPTFQSIGSRSFDKIIDTRVEKNTPQLPQDEMIMSDKEETTCAASKSKKLDSITSSSKTSLSRPGRRPLGFLSLICSKNSLESDEPTQVHSKKRLKPRIPVSRQNLKRSNPLSESQKKIQEASDLLPSPSVVANTHSENISSSATKASCDPSLPKEVCKSVQNQALDEEPPVVSEHFFSDIFIEVDETE
ncbi:PREDICTED: transcription factor TFIIIB component B'' homolog [Hipposideros armiger]|uniref:Transcription factor TFIIIB component B'' homolog n=1 Tax=Hipposideros armiger TaxID=186990 RepID=A0A8B7QF67_HIPAR|nr:PREDICTED: transcription factor TFIIIB component B'' homolog [Hipposideros armiger]